ncbi:hypothetical protein SEA_TRIBUTE_221 [Streptomyces phage Tribute]|uniref:Uncharacterized protein n=4 Tax=Samistivirus peebs TaxID=2560790 RepID=A0A5Q2WLB2_9CAUD|nr:hypothetical protein SEA_SUSHI23_226 [Streptomyces phage Sushi23]QAX95915.1 hypothetical protein SEA_TEUTSCH_224 [Streptomyces phage Teutsch]QGH78371.1 hypothetical protein SEA_TRIBUTE_221 [Streptomyces phage Tribute]QRI46172.1 hypothetical protein SEA_CROSS_224 [Streptomyces phage Cross]WDS51979.1 hypothetical protein SEA_PEPPERWOOD_225 [Streptomyces phage Pepperwood]WNN95543.1 hypothetical protein SEA_WATERMOORE_224 [Streptomyces phage Watermoore]
MHRESQVVRVETDEGDAFGIIEKVLAFHCLVKYWDDEGQWQLDYFEHDEVEVIGEIGYEEE